MSMCVCVGVRGQEEGARGGGVAGRGKCVCACLCV